MSTPLSSNAYPTSPTMPSASPVGYVTPTAPANPSKFEPPLTSGELASRRTQFYELLLKQVVQALTGFFLPGQSATSQLGSFGSSIPIIGPLVQAITGVVGGTMNAITGFFGNLGGRSGSTGGFLPFDLTSGSFNPLSGAANFIGSILNLSTSFGSLFTGGLIPPLDGSKIGSGLIGDQFTGVGVLREALVNGLVGPDGDPIYTNDDLTQLVHANSLTASSALQSAARANNQLVQANGNAVSNTGVGGLYQTHTPSGPSGGLLR